MTNPNVLVLDEARGAGPLVRRRIWQMIRKIKVTGIATIVVDKNVDVLFDLADRGDHGQWKDHVRRPLLT